MDVEAVVLTGGRGRRMGTDKAGIAIDGVPMGLRLVRSLLSLEIPVTVLGRESIEGAAFIPDSDEFAGPLAALEAFSPSRGAIFIASCDMPLFDSRLVRALCDSLEKFDAAIPVIDGRRQPLCALYGHEAFQILKQVRADGQSSIRAWTDRLQVLEIEASWFASARIDITRIRGVNTPEELDKLLADRPASA